MRPVRTISALLLAFLVLMSSTSFMVGMHLCRDEVKSVAVFSKAGQCPMHQQKAPVCPDHKKSDCCKDEVYVHEGDDFKNSASNHEAPGPSFIVASTPFVFISDVVPSTGMSHDSFIQYDPPLYSCDLTVSLGVFLI
jgi:hypothetical protein